MSPGKEEFAMLAYFTFIFTFESNFWGSFTLTIQFNAIDAHSFNSK